VSDSTKGQRRSGDRGLFLRRGQWGIQYFFNGQRFRVTVGPSKAMARAALAKRKAEIAEGKFFPDRERRLKTRLTTWIDQQLEITESTHKDQRHRRIYGEFWKDKLGALPVGAVRPSDVEKAIQGLRASRKAATANRYLAFLKRIFTAAQDDGLVDRNPVRPVKLVREPAGRIRWLTDEEEKAVLAQLDDRGKALVSLAVHTGLRQGEQWRLRWSDLSLDRKRAFVADAKSGDSRWVRLNDDARDALDWLDAHRESERICPGSAALAAQHFADACCKAGVVDFRWHDLRHTFASRLVMADQSIKTVQVLLGHKTITMTMRYAHLAESHLDEAVAKIATTGSATKQPLRLQKAAGDVVALSALRSETDGDSNS